MKPEELIIRAKEFGSEDRPWQSVADWTSENVILPREVSTMLGHYHPVSCRVQSRNWNAEAEATPE